MLLARRRMAITAMGLALAVLALPARASGPDPDLSAVYRTEVDKQLDIPPPEVKRYSQMAEASLALAGKLPMLAQYVLLVDRSPQVQALLLYWRDATGDYRLVGASPVSTGRPGSYDYFMTPVGVFEHSRANPDFRAEGTRNAKGIRGYGVKGMRVFDFGWQQAAKGWGNHEVITMRLQMHATDPTLLEQRLGSVQSKGCVRIAASLNRLLDHYGVLDADYEGAQEHGHAPWVLQPKREPIADAGRYLVIVDSESAQRPEWSPLPAALAPPKPAASKVP
jgi:hypothetical protein